MARQSGRHGECNNSHAHCCCCCKGGGGRQRRRPTRERSEGGRLGGGRGRSQAHMRGAWCPSARSARRCSNTCL